MRPGEPAPVARRRLEPELSDRRGYAPSVCGSGVDQHVEALRVTRLTVGGQRVRAELLRDDWHSELAREGLAPVAAPAPVEAEHLPCPACGTAAPLVDGACSDCGLQLE